ncbi:o-succinylbenzoate--CoA ligase [Bacillus aquiflavi]|uniref:2-succinylbenzoate--CoA ligase n=1 Tax=Bacillus aquiflavi TaxID=2672567 RepID=A0A6B3W2A6_9BACI|nr:o-succinylbenzoate--CoA ligase [Bacillus aquiflavi]MBA4537409.1 o-succinylbenzoate--CoA ligase [Bacillus aquiflavi]NEY81664.1 o-succinylbenzoate--CoA ligase [Bacillus aquiflavi]UAC47647.1 o-succinylbenzoate--CoA ligase [Bacillus aquiflavi]
MEETIPNWLTKRAHLTPDRIALKFKGEEYSFQCVYDQSLKIARQLKGLHLKEGDFVGVLLKNHADTVFILFGLQLLGVKTILLNNRLTADELVYQLKDSKAKCLIYEQSFDFVVKNINKQILADLMTISKEALFGLEEQEVNAKEEFCLENVCTVMYTSGTTGRPKGVLQTYGNHWWSAIGSMLNLGLREGDCWLLSVPFFHISGFSILIRGVIYGITVVLHESFDEKAANDAIIHDRVTIMSVVSTMLVKMVDHLKDQSYPAYFRCMLLGGGPAPRTLLETCAKKQIPVFQTYGMTETASQIVTLAPEYSLSKLGSAGKPLFLAQLKIKTVTGNEAAPYETGEIVVKGPNVTKGYLNKMNETKEKIQAGWLYTGDIGYLDHEGFLFVLDRRSDLIISGGENIYPAEIESVLLGHAKVDDAGVIGVDDVKWGQIPVGFVVLKSNANVNENDLLEYCQKKLAKYKVPKKIIFLQQLPRNASRKLLRRKLRDYYR